MLMRLLSQKATQEEKPPAGQSTVARENYKKASRKLRQLKGELDLYRDEVANQEIKLASVHSELRRYSLSSNGRPAGMPDEDFDAVAAKILIDGTAKHLAEIRKLVSYPETLRVFYGIDTLIARDDARCAIELLRRAIKLQESRLKECERLAVEEMTVELKPERQRLVGAIVAALTQLSEAKREEWRFADKLLQAEPDLAGGLRPQLFPNHVDSKIIQWLGEVQDAGMATHQQISGLLPEGEGAEVAAE